MSKGRYSEEGMEFGFDEKSSASEKIEYGFGEEHASSEVINQSMIDWNLSIKAAKPTPDSPPTSSEETTFTADRIKSKATSLKAQYQDNTYEGWEGLINKQRKILGMDQDQYELPDSYVKNDIKTLVSLAALCKIKGDILLKPINDKAGRIREVDLDNDLLFNSVTTRLDEIFNGNSVNFSNARFISRNKWMAPTTEDSFTPKQSETPQPSLSPKKP
jgi:hypothetical protein